MLNSESLLNNKYYLDMDEYVYKMNLKVLRKKDKDIEQIICRCKYSILHELERSIKIWHKCGYQGPLFFVTRKDDTNIKIVLLNQKDTHDYIEEIYPNIKIEFNEQSQFIFIENKNGVIKGFWINDLNDLLNAKQIVKKFLDKQ